MTDKAEFLRLFREARAGELAKLDQDFDRALKDDDAEKLKKVRQRRRDLLDLPDLIEGDDRESLIPQWPADFPPLPLEFANPRAAASGPPLGADLVVKADPPPAPPQEPAADLVAAVLARRRERAPAEDEERRKPKPAPAPGPRRRVLNFLKKLGGGE